MTLADILRRALDVAIAGTNPDSSILQAMTMEATVLCEQALDELSTEVAGNPELRARLERTSSVALVNGIGVIPAGMFVEYLREGSVKDNDGNILQRVKYYNDFLNFLPSAYGYYCINNNQFRTRQISSGSFTDTATPLTIDAPFIPTSATVAVDVPDELEGPLIDILAVKLRGIIARMPV